MCHCQICILLKRSHFPHCKAFDLQVRKAIFRLRKHCIGHLLIDSDSHEAVWKWRRVKGKVDTLFDLDILGGTSLDTLTFSEIVYLLTDTKNF